MPPTTATAARTSRVQLRSGFTLLEVVLAIALSATLLALIASAIGMFLFRVDDGRQRVEQAQLARNLMRLVAADIRNVAVYSPQDTSIAAQLAASAGSFDVDLISGGGGGSSGSGGGGGSGSGGGTGGGSGTGAGGGTGTGGSGSSSDSGDSSSSASTNAQYQQPLGVYGNLNELQIDVLQPARPMPASGALGQGDLTGPLWSGGIRTVRYYYRDGERPTGDAIVTERFSSTGRTAFGGLVREATDRQHYDFAVQQGTANSFAELGQVLAPEVAGIQFRYSDGVQIYDEWNSETQQALPVAIEITLWLEKPFDRSRLAAESTTVDLAEATQYVMTVPIWRASLAASAGSSAESGSSSSGTGSGASGSGSGGSSSGGTGTSGGSSSF